MTARRIWSGTEKLRVVLESVNPGVNVEAVCRALGIHAAQFYQRKDPALAAMKAGLESRAWGDLNPRPPG